MYIWFISQFIFELSYATRFLKFVNTQTTNSTHYLVTSQPTQTSLLHSSFPNPTYTTTAPNPVSQDMGYNGRSSANSLQHIFWNDHAYATAGPSTGSSTSSQGIYDPVFSTTKSLQDVSWVDHVYATTIPTQSSKCSSQGSYHNGTSMTNSVPDISGFDNADATTAFVQGSTASTSGVTVCLDDLENTLMDYSHPTSSVDAGLDSRFPLLNV